MQWVVIKKGMTKSLLVVNLYKPHFATVINLLDRLSAAYKKVDRQKCNEVFFLGDFNVNLRIRDTDQEKLIDHFAHWGCDQLITDITHINPNNEDTTIDLNIDI